MIRNRVETVLLPFDEIIAAAHESYRAEQIGGGLNAQL